MPEKVVRSGARYSWQSGLWAVLWPIALKVFCKMWGKTWGWQRLLRQDHRLFQEEDIGGSHRVCIFKSLLAVLRPAIWFGDWTEVCPGKCLLTGQTGIDMRFVRGNACLAGQTGSEMSFVRCKWGFLRHYRCMIEGLMSINYLKLCDFVKYVL